MTDKTHFESFVDHVMSDDISDISNLRAERDYALHCLEREIAICAQTQARNDAMVKALQSIASNTCCDRCQEAALVAKAAIASIKDDQNA